MLQLKIKQLLEKALSAIGATDTIQFKIDIPSNDKLGDYASNIAIVNAKKLSQNPMQLAQSLVDKIDQSMFDKIEIAKPGFINFFLKQEYILEQIMAIPEQDHVFGHNNAFLDQSVLIEYVSANPTGPLHVGHGRWAVVGDVISKLLKACGAKVVTEFYVNNIGNQVEKLWLSIEAVRMGKPVPENGYGGEYVKDIKGETKELALENVLNEQKAILSRAGVIFDNFFFESDLHEKDLVNIAIKLLTKNGHTYEKEGAIWFAAQALGDDKDRVLIRADGVPTYFAADIAYHLEKANRGFSKLINIWGTDHHGYVARLKLALKALGLDENRLEIIIGQLVTLYRGDEPVRMSKRTGEMVSLEEVLDEIGPDATRFFFAASDVNSHLDFDLELAKKHSTDNPVFYLQYAHARIASILRKSSDEQQATIVGEIELNDPAERKLMLKILSWPDVVREAARLRHPHRITEYGKELATTFHHFYEKCRVLGNPSRIFLADCSRITLRNVLELLGISVPESM